MYLLISLSYHQFICNRVMRNISNNYNIIHHNDHEHLSANSWYAIF